MSTTPDSAPDPVWTVDVYYSPDRPPRASHASRFVMAAPDAYDAQLAAMQMMMCGSNGPDVHAVDSVVVDWPSA